MTNNGFKNADPVTWCGASGSRQPQGGPEILRHLTLALVGHVRRLHQEGFPVPHEVEELAVLLVQLARIRQDPPISAPGLGPIHDTGMPNRLLVTKAEAAEQLGVSVRTIERLVAAGRLSQVHIERLARFRVSDLEAFVNGLADDHLFDDNVGTEA